MFCLHYPIFILSPPFLPPTPPKYVHWSECLVLNCVVIFSQYLQTQTLCCVCVKVGKIRSTCFLYPVGGSQIFVSWGKHSSWGSSFPSVRPRKTFSFRGELSRITIIFSDAKRIIEVGRDLSRSSSPVPLLQHWLFHHLPRD